jgi:hypothetical protein
MSYRVLALPNLKAMSLEVVRKLRDLAGAGATIVGPKPERCTGRQNDAELKRLADELWDSGKITTRTAREALAALQVASDVEGIPDWIHRRAGGADIYFVCNQQAQATNRTISFRGTGKQPELWDAVTGERRAAAAFTQKDGRTIVPLEFAPYGSLFVIFRKPVMTNGTGRNSLSFTPVTELTGPWKMTFEKRQLTFEKLVDWTTHPEVRFFSGTATYRMSFDAPKTSERLFLDLGNLSMLAELRLNGKNLGVVWCPPWRVEISEALKPTGNMLEVAVVNGWWNQLVGDQNHERTKTNIRLKPAAQPQTSGLLGPVTIQAAQ